MSTYHFLQSLRIHLQAGETVEEALLEANRENLEPGQECPQKCVRQALHRMTPSRQSQSPDDGA